METQRDKGSQAACIHIGRVKHILALECDVTRGKLSGLAACPRAAQSASTWRRLLFLTPTRPPSQTFDTFYIFRQSDPIPGSIWIKQETMNHKDVGTSWNRLHVLVWKSQSLLNSGWRRLQKRDGFCRMKFKWPARFVANWVKWGSNQSLKISVITNVLLASAS